MGATQSISTPYTLTTPRGRLQGISQKHSKTNQPILQRYTRIPYALPPLGPLRFRRPQPLPSTFTFDSPDGTPGNYTTFGPICPQGSYDVGDAFVDNPSAAPPLPELQDGDCLYLNIWVPAGDIPDGGWPVQFHIHGGWLQVGNAMQTHDHDPFDLLRISTKRIIVSPTYRLNLFGFLAGEALGSSDDDGDAFGGNYGLWDQRMALEWTARYIGFFSGDSGNITVGGLSAGAHSAFLQLYYDSMLGDGERVVRRCYLQSNAVAIQPNGSAGRVVTEQFDALCEAVGVEGGLSVKEKLDVLRSVDARRLVDAIPGLKYPVFRSVTDGDISGGSGGFVPSGLMQSLHDGSFAALLASHGVQLLLGEVRDEAELYKLANPPMSRSSLVSKLRNYYPATVVDALVNLPLYEVPKNDKGVSNQQWADIFGMIVADVQVHASIRGATHCLLSPLSGKPPKVFRYRINWRAKALDNWLKPFVGVCHASDTPIWWMSGLRCGFSDADQKTMEEFLEPFGRFLEGREVVWDDHGRSDQVRVIGEDGVVKGGVLDEDWGRGMAIWDAIWKAQKTI